MSDEKSQEDTSMEDILASIRRIITDDGAEREAAGNAANPGKKDDDVLELTQMIKDDGTTVDLSEKTKTETETETSALPEPAARPESEGKETVALEPGSREPEAESVFEPREPEAESAPKPAAVPEFEVEFAPKPPELEAKPAPEPPAPEVDTEAEPTVTVGPEPVAKPEPKTKIQTSVDVEDLISQAASSASISAMAKLAEASEPKIPPTSDLKIREQGCTVEEIVVEMLRPMLREWLDRNLPIIVERIVQKEIRKLARQADSD